MAMHETYAQEKDGRHLVQAADGLLRIPQPSTDPRDPLVRCLYAYRCYNTNTDGSELASSQEAAPIVYSMLVRLVWSFGTSRWAIGILSSVEAL